MAGEGVTGGGFISAPRLSGFGRLKGASPNSGGQGEVLGAEGGGRGSVERGAGGRWRQGAAGGRQGGGLPPSMRNMFKDKKSKKIVSLSFAEFVEIPEVTNLHMWMKDDQLLRQDVQDPRKNIDWIERNQFSKKFHVHMKEEEGAAWLMEKYGEHGRTTM